MPLLTSSLCWWTGPLGNRKISRWDHASGSLSGPSQWERLQSSPRSPSWIWGPLCSGRERKGEVERGAEGKEGEGREWKERGGPLKLHIPGSFFTPVCPWLSWIISVTFLYVLFHTCCHTVSYDGRLSLTRYILMPVYEIDYRYLQSCMDRVNIVVVVSFFNETLTIAKQHWQLTSKT